MSMFDVMTSSQAEAHPNREMHPVARLLVGTLIFFGAVAAGISVINGI
jgi:hypothetical protein